jgi:hypothetical protein
MEGSSKQQGGGWRKGIGESMALEWAEAPREISQNSITRLVLVVKN